MTTEVETKGSATKAAPRATTRRRIHWRDIGANWLALTILVLLACGLAVDYAAHIGHMFACVRGTRGERASQTLVSRATCFAFFWFAERIVRE